MKKEQERFEHSLEHFRVSTLNISSRKESVEVGRYKNTDNLFVSERGR
jgi:hypothetical protein